jgi:MFS family permease
VSRRSDASRATAPEAAGAQRPDQPPGLPPAARSGLGRGFASLAVRNYRLYWSGQVVSLIGTWMQQVSLPWLVLELHGTPLQLGLVAVGQFLPAGVLAPFGGVVADRFDKRRLLIITQLLAMAQAVTLFVIIVTGIVDAPMIMACALWLGLINAVDMPLRQALAADLVPRETLPNAIALNSMAFNSARVLGPALAGVLIGLGAGLFGSAIAGVAINVGLNAVTYSASLVGLLLMNSRQIRRQHHPDGHPPVLESLREGFLYALRMPIVLWSLVLLGGVAAFGFNFQILLPLFAAGVLGLGAEGYGALFAAMGLGSLAGSLSMAFMRQRPAIHLMLGGGVVFAVLEIILGVTRDVWVAGLLVLAAGLASMLMINTVNSVVQANVSDRLRGRVMALYVTVFAGSAPLGSLFAGALAEGFGAPPAFIAGAVLSLVVLAIVAWRFRVAALQGRLGITRIDNTGLRPEGRPDTSPKPSAAA